MYRPEVITMTTIEGEIKNLTRVWLAVIASLCYCHFISARLPKGKWRLISLVPIFYVFLIVPRQTTCVFFTAVTALFIAWIANFKLLLFAFNQGPIASDHHPPKSLPVFIALAALPVRLKPQNDTPTPKKSKKLPLYLATEIPILATVIATLPDYKEHIHLYIVLFAYCCLLFLFLDVMFEVSSLLAHALLGVELEPLFDEPYLSTSIQEFWGRRWNLTVNSILHQMVYNPVRSAAAPLLGRDLAAMAALLVAFLVSGLMHELVVWYVTQARPSWEMTMYFVVQGLGIVVEFGLKVAFSGKKWRLPLFVRWLLTLGFVVAPTFWWFFPPFTRNGADTRVFEELLFVGGLVEEKLKEIWCASRSDIGLIT